MAQTMIDADGHVSERDDVLIDYLPAPFTSKRRLFSHYFFTLSDNFHRSAELLLDGATAEDRDVLTDAEQLANWQRVLDESGMRWTALYPGRGLTINKLNSPEWGGALARGYNDWLFDRFVSRDPRLKGIALLHLYDPEAAAGELRRCVDELGFIGGVLMTSGLATPLGDEVYASLYEEAQRLDIGLAVHAASSNALGLASGARALWEVRALSHGAGQILSFLSMVNGGVFDAFPRLRVAFLESGCGWVPYLVDRMDRVYRGRSQRLSQRLKQSPGEHLAGGRIFVHTELDEAMLPVVAEVAGRDDIFLFASDYPHEPWRAAERGIAGFLDRDDLSDALRRNVLAHAAERFYRIDIGGQSL